MFLVHQSLLGSVPQPLFQDQMVPPVPCSSAASSVDCTTVKVLSWPVPNSVTNTGARILLPSRQALS